MPSAIAHATGSKHVPLQPTFRNGVRTISAYTYSKHKHVCFAMRVALFSQKCVKHHVHISQCGTFRNAGRTLPPKHFKHYSYDSLCGSNHFAEVCINTEMSFAT